MPDGQTCPNCGASIPAESPAGQCAKCLLGSTEENLSGEGTNLAFSRKKRSTILVVPEGAAPNRNIEESPQKGFGDFEFLTKGKEGGMGVVFRARQISLNRIVGLKMIRAGNLATDRDVQRFQTEAEAAASLDHPHIVPIYEVGEHEGRHYFTMKWVEGHSLAEALSQSRLPAGHAAISKLMAKIAMAIQHAHERGVLHRDLKPGNILIDKNGEPHVTDFGLAKRLESHPELTASGAIMGTPSYMSPEQAEGKNRQLTTASDIFSLGSILYQLLTGQTPFRGETAFKIIRVVIEEEPARPSTINRKIDPDLETICLKCLEKDPQRRYASASGLATDLENWLAGKPIQARRVNEWERMWKWVRRHPAISSLSTAIVLTIVIGLLGMSWQWTKTAEANLRLQSQRADNFLAANKTHFALATLARMTRDDPWNRAAAERLVNLLNQRPFLMPLPIHSATNRSPTPATAAIDGVSRDGNLRVCRHETDADSFRVLETATTNLITFFSNAHSAPIRNLRFSPDGQRVVSASDDKTAKIWQVRTGKRLHTLTHSARVTWAEFSPDGQTIVTATVAPDAAARFWNASNGQATLAKVIQHILTINTAHFSQDGTLLITASDDGTAQLWNTQTGSAYSEPVRVLKAVDDARFDADQIILTLADQEVRVYRPTDELKLFHATVLETPVPEIIAAKTQSLSSYANRLQSTYSEEITCLDLCLPLDLLATASIDKSARVWKAGALHPVGVPLIHDTRVNCVRFSGDGLRLVTSTAGPLTRVRIWDVQTSQPLSDPIEWDHPVAAVDFSSDGKWIITSAGWKWRLYPIAGRTPEWLPELAEAIAGIQFTASGLTEPIKDERWTNLAKELRRSKGSDDLIAWGRDFLQSGAK
jgi:eukaryotic-like serine/threonine-protein kinase